MLPISIPEDQYRFQTLQDNPKNLFEHEQTDFLVLTTLHKKSTSQKFIYEATFEEDITDNIQFNTYTTYADIIHPTDMEENSQISPIHTNIVTGAGHAAPPAYSDLQNPTFSDHMPTQPILAQFFEQMGAKPKPTNPFYFPPPIENEELRELREFRNQF